MKHKKLVIRLIKADLINSKLVNALEDLGLDAGGYFINLSDTIFKLIGFSNNTASEEVYEHYLELTKKARQIDLSPARTHIDKLAREIYFELLVLQARTK